MSYNQGHPAYSTPSFIPHQLQTQPQYHNHGWNAYGTVGGYPTHVSHAAQAMAAPAPEPAVEPVSAEPSAPTPAVIMAAPKKYVPEVPTAAPTPGPSTSFYKPMTVATAPPNPISKSLKQSTSEKGFFSVYQYNPDGNNKKKQKKVIRTAGGQVWEDQSLHEWDPDDFRVFCGDLGNDVNDEVLTRTFSKYPSFVKAKVVKDKRTNKSKGYGFVSFKDPKDYVKAVREMNGKYVGSRPIKLRKSNWKDRNLDIVRKKKAERASMGFKV